MATISKRSISSTFRPLSEMWDENGRIRPAAAEPEPQEPEPQGQTAEERQARAEGVRMAARKQRDMAADEQRNEDIETFIKDPETFFGATVRRADFGVKEFSFGGRRVYTYNADAEAAERDALARLDERKTFAELLTVDMPGKIDVATRLWAEGGDRDGARAEISAVDAFVKDNYDTLVTLTRYNGQDQLAANIADKARGMISGAYKVPFSTMDRDPEIKAKVAQKQALDAGFGEASTDTYVKGVVEHDPDALALWRVAGAPTRLDPTPGASGTGGTPQEARAASLGADTGTIERFLKHAEVSSVKMAAGLGDDVLQIMTPDTKARFLKAGFDSGDEESGGAVTDIVVGAVSSVDGLDPRGKLNLAESMMKTASSAHAAWGRVSDPLWVAKGVKTFASLQPLLPGTRMAERGSEVAATLSSVAKTAEGAGSFGVNLSDKGMSTIARVRLASSLNMAQNLLPAEQKLKAEIDGFRALSAGIRVDADWMLPAEKRAASGDKSDTPSMYRMQKDAIDVVFELASADMAETGVDRDTAVMRNIKPLSSTLLAQGAVSADVAEATSKFMMKHLMANNGGNLAGIADDVRAKRGELADLEKNDLVGADPGVGLPVKAAAQARAKNATAIDGAIYTALHAASPGDIDVLKPGSGEWNALRAATKKATKPLADALVSVQSSMFSVLADTPLSQLDSADTRGKAIEAFITQAKTMAPRTASLVSDAALASIGAQVVDKVVRGMYGKVGYRPGISFAEGTMLTAGRPSGIVGDATYRGILATGESGEAALTARPISGLTAPMLKPGATYDEQMQYSMSAKDLAERVLPDLFSVAVLDKAVGGVKGPGVASLVAPAAGGAIPAGIAGGILRGGIRTGLEKAAEASAMGALDSATVLVEGTGEAAEQAALAALDNATVVVPGVAGRQVLGIAAKGAGAVAGLATLAYALGLDKVQPADGANIAIKSKQFADTVFMGPEKPRELKDTDTEPTGGAALSTDALGPGAVTPTKKAPKTPGYGDLFLDPKFNVKDVLATLDTVLNNSRAAAESEMENELVFKTIPNRLERLSLSKSMDVQNNYFNEKRLGKIKSFNDARTSIMKNVEKVEAGVEEQRLEYLRKSGEIRKKLSGDDDAIVATETSSGLR